MALNERMIREVEKALKEGAKSITAIHRQLFTSRKYRKGYLSFWHDFREREWELPEGFRGGQKAATPHRKGKKKKRIFTEEVREEIQCMLDSGAYGSVLTVYNKLHRDGTYSLVYGTFLKEFVSHSFTLPAEFGKRGYPMKPNPIRDALILQDPPLRLEEIAAREVEKTGKSVTVEGIRGYMERHGLHDEWKGRRESYTHKEKEGKKTDREIQEEIRQQQTHLINTLLNYYIQRATTEDIPKAYAARYYYGHQRRKNRIRLETLEKLFETYFDAKQKGIKLSLPKLEDKTNIEVMSILRILYEAGEEAMFGSLERHLTPQYKKQALRRAIDIEMNAGDIAYFVAVQEHVASQNMRIYGRKKEKLFAIARSDRWKRLSYRHASQVYEAVDLGFTPEETQTLTDISRKAYDLLIERRAEIEPKIVAALKVMYDAPAHDVPYVTKVLRESMNK